MDWFLLNLIFLGIPVVITGLNVWNVFAKRKLIPRLLLLLTVFLGIFFYLCYFCYCTELTFIEWNEPVYEGEKHTFVSNEFLPSFWGLFAVGIASLFTIALVPAKKLSPIAASIAFAGVLIGNALNLFYGLQVAPLFFMKTPPYFEGLLECAPILFHFNILLLSIYYVRKQILEQIPLMDGKIERTNSVLIKRLYSFLKKVLHWHVVVFAALVPLAVLIEIVLILFGQGADGFIKMFTMTADWTFSTQVPPPPLEYTGHYLCTVAAGGHKKLVKPLRFGNRRGAKILVNRQLMVANAFEELIQEKAPRLHKKIRGFYDAHGYPLSRLITTPLRADVVYVLMKPLEWIFAFTLYLFCTNPEEKILKQYA